MGVVVAKPPLRAVGKKSAAIRARLLREDLPLIVTPPFTEHFVGFAKRGDGPIKPTLRQKIKDFDLVTDLLVLRDLDDGLPVALEGPLVEQAERLLADRGSAGLALRPPAPGWWGVAATDQLCLACGLCCDGTLFDGVQLEPGDDPKHLKSLGLPVTISRARQPVARFPQPCAALCADRTCRLYPDRPRQCRVFECGVFKAASAGRIDGATALRLVKRARHHAAQVRRLLLRLGDTEERRSLGERFHRMQCRLETEATDAAARATFADLSLAMHRLKLLAHAKFYTQSPKATAGAGEGDR